MVLYQKLIKKNKNIIQFLKFGPLREQLICSVFKVNLELCLFFKNVIFDKEVSHIYLEPKYIQIQHKNRSDTYYVLKTSIKKNILGVPVNFPPWAGFGPRAAYCRSLFL